MTPANIFPDDVDAVEEIAALSWTGLLSFSNRFVVDRVDRSIAVILFVDESMLH